MKPLVLTLKHEPGQRLDLAPLVPHLLEGKSAKDIAEIELQTTREKVAAGDIFKIRSAGGVRRFISKAAHCASTTSVKA